MNFCEKVECPKAGDCPYYSKEGIAFRSRHDYCPIIDKPRKDEAQVKTRVGQQKGRRNKA